MGSAVNILPHGVWSEVLTHANCEFCQMGCVDSEDGAITVPNSMTRALSASVMFILRQNISTKLSKKRSVCLCYNSGLVKAQINLTHFVQHLTILSNKWPSRLLLVGVKECCLVKYFSNFGSKKCVIELNDTRMVYLDIFKNMMYRQCRVVINYM